MLGRGGLPGASRGPPGGILGPPGASPALLGSVSKLPVGVPWGRVAPRGPPRGLRVASRGLPGASRGLPGGLLGAPGASPGLPGARWEPLGGRPELSWAVLSHPIFDTSFDLARKVEKCRILVDLVTFWGSRGSISGGPGGPFGGPSGPKRGDVM